MGAAYNARGPLSGGDIVRVPEIAAALATSGAAGDDALDVVRDLVAYLGVQDRARGTEMPSRGGYDAKQKALIVGRLIVGRNVGNKSTDEEEEEDEFLTRNERRRAAFDVSGQEAGEHWGRLRNEKRGNRSDFGRAFVGVLKAYVNGPGASSTQPSARGGRRANDAALVLETSLDLVEQLDRSPDYYPTRLTPSVLAQTLTVSDVSVGSRNEPTRAETSRRRPALEVLRAHRRLVLLGEPGGGKTTVLAAHVVSYIRESKVAVFVRLSDVAKTSGAPRDIRQAVSMVVAAAGIPLEDARDALARRLASDPQVVIAFDGLDEVFDQDEKRVTRELLDQLSTLPGTLIVSSRTLGYRSLGDEWSHRSVDYLSWDRAREILARWFGGTDSDAYRRSASVFEELDFRAGGGAAVLLGIIAHVAEAGTVPDTEVGLYARYLELFIRRDWKPAERALSDPEVAARAAIASRLAWYMAIGAEAQQAPTTWRTTVTLAEAFAAIPDHTVELHELAQHAGLLVPVGSPDTPLQQSLRWVHRTFHEYLAAVHLAQQLGRGDTGALSVVTNAIQQPSGWLKTLQYLMQLLPPQGRDAVVEAIIELREAGDPGEVLLDGLVELLPHVDELSLPRRQYARKLARRLEFSEAALVHEDVANECFRELLMREGEVPAEVFASIQEFTVSRYGDWPFDADALDDLMDFFVRNPPDSDVEPSLLTLYAQLDINDALRMEHERLSETGEFLPMDFELDERPTVDEPILRLYTDAVTTRPFPENLPFAEVLARIGHLDALASDGVEHPTGVILACWLAERWRSYWDVYPIFSAGGLPDGLFDEVLAGKHGDYGSYRAAHSLPDDHPITDAMSVPAVLGYVTSRNIRLPRGGGYAATYALRERLVKEGDAVDAVARFAAVSPEIKDDPEALLGLWKAAVATEETSDVTLLEAALSARAVVNELADQSASSSIDIGWHSLVAVAEALERVVKDAPFETAWTAIQRALLGGVLLLESDDVFFVENVIDRTARDADALLEILRWADEHELPIPIALPHDVDNADRFWEVAWETVQHKEEVFGPASHALARSFADIGLLAKWRDRLLAFTQHEPDRISSVSPRRRSG